MQLNYAHQMSRPQSNSKQHLCSIVLLGIVVQFACAKVSAQNAKDAPQGVASLVGGNELRISLPSLIATTNQNEKTPSFRSVAFSNMSSRSMPGVTGDNTSNGSALLIQSSERGVDVQMIEGPDDPIFAVRSGLLIWSQQGREQWKYHRSPNDQEQIALETLTSSQRSSDIPSHPLNGLTPTNALQQLAGLSLVRGSPNFLTPSENKARVTFMTPMAEIECLNPNITIRREVDQDGNLPEIQIALVRGRLSDQGLETLATFEFPEGEHAVQWSDLADVPTGLRDRLPPGTYSLVAEDNRGSVESFKVGESDFYDAVSENLVGTFPDGLRVPPALKTLFTVEYLLGNEDEFGRATPYLCDALDAIERLEKTETGRGLNLIRQTILAESGHSEKPSPDPYSTGIEAVDKARQQIAQGRWAFAKTTLESADPATNREAGLIKLYQATITAESGATQLAEADRIYRAAINLLSNEAPADSWRAYNNYGVLLLNTAQDLLNNHSLQIASGVRSPISAALIKWQQAKQAFIYAAITAERVNQTTLANVSVNQARLNAVMADVLSTLVFPDERDRARRQQLVKVSQRRATEYASIAADDEGLDPVTRGAAVEILAQLSFRARKITECEQRCDRALQHYTDAGSLAGVESVLRLQGMAQLAGDKSTHDLGVETLIASSKISDVLYDRIPGDETGRSKAGFFSRRGYVSSRIVEELIKRGDFELAADYAEEAKARSLKEVLSARKLGTAAVHSETRWVGEIAADLADDTVVLKYFLGPSNCYAFLISHDGVQATQLHGEDGTPVDSCQLITSVVSLQSKMGHQAKQMLARIRAGKPLDHSWQHDLNELFHQLIPAKFVRDIRRAKSLVIVPQHVLHYVPFSALVTETDNDPNKEGRPTGYDGRFYGGMAQPKFLIDEGVNITIAPSLTSWDLIRKRSRPIESASAMGIAEFQYAQALPGVKVDLDNFQDIFGTQVREMLPGHSANEENALRMLTHPGVLLIATHGMNVADNPLESFLLCHASSESDGRLTAREIFESKVQSEMVVMSACYTGLADRSPMPGDDLFGLQRSLLVAGSNTVISGLWDVYDGTGPTLMKGFFERFRDGKTAAESLAETQRAYLRQLRRSDQVEFYLHPYFWSVYNVAGDGAVRFESAKN